jgi:hypothetical protein
MKLTDNMALNYYPVFIPLNRIFRKIMKITVGPLFFKCNHLKESMIFTGRGNIDAQNS